MMAQHFKQLGSSTTGLLTATAIYAGLLAYANFYAFDNNPATITLDEGEPVTEQLKLAETKPRPEASVTGENLAVATDEEVKAVEQSVQQQVANLPQTTQPSVNTLPPQQVVSAGALGSLKNQQQLSNTDQFQSRFYNQYDQYLATNGYASGQGFQRGYGRSQGRGNGRMNSDGEFSFSLKFKSRAKMDADSTMDGQLANTYYSNQFVSYQQQQASQPGYALQYSTYAY